MAGNTKAKGGKPKDGIQRASGCRYPPAKPQAGVPQNNRPPAAKVHAGPGVYAPTHYEGIQASENYDAAAADKPPKVMVAKPKKSNPNAGADSKPDVKAQQPNRSWKRFLYAAVTFTVICGLFTGAYFIFLVKDIKVSGNEKYTAERLIEQSGLKVGELIFLQNLDAAKALLSMDPYINVISVEREFPNRISINVSERKEAAAIRYTDYYVIIDHDGFVLSIDRRSDLGGLLQVFGIKAAGYQVNKPLGSMSDFNISTAVSIIKALEAHQLTQTIESIDVSNPLKVQMTTTDGLLVRLGQPDEMDNKLRKLIKVMPELKSRLWFSGTLDLSAKGDPVYCAPEKTPDEAEMPADPDDTAG